jgi:hypothetical protein
VVAPECCAGFGGAELVARRRLISSRQPARRSDESGRGHPR